LIIRITTIVPQITVPFAALLAPPAVRGKVVGTVMSGLLIGILLARTVNGFVGAGLGWQAMYWIASGFMLVLAIVLLQVLPKSHPDLSLVDALPIEAVARACTARSFNYRSNGFWSV
jgi:predicted MFS family arabinose efflux permease